MAYESETAGNRRGILERDRSGAIESVIYIQLLGRRAAWLVTLARVEERGGGARRKFHSRGRGFVVPRTRARLALSHTFRSRTRAPCSPFLSPLPPPRPSAPRHLEGPFPRLISFAQLFSQRAFRNNAAFPPPREHEFSLQLPVNCTL